MKRRFPGRLAADCRAATAIEFALCGSLFLLLVIGFFELGLALWMMGALQSAAALTARCAAIGSSDCPDPQQFAVSTAQSWTFWSVISRDEVSVASSSTCNGVAGTFERVTITCPFCAAPWLMARFVSLPSTVSECYPVNSSALG